MKLTPPTDEGWEQRVVGHDEPPPPGAIGEPESWEHAARDLRVDSYAAKAPEFDGRCVLRVTIGRIVAKEPPTDDDVALVRTELGLENADEEHSFDPSVRGFVQLLSQADVGQDLDFRLERLAEEKDEKRARDESMARLRRGALVLVALGALVGLLFLEPCNRVRARILFRAAGNWTKMQTVVPKCRTLHGACNCSWEAKDHCDPSYSATAGKTYMMASPMMTHCGGNIVF